MSGPTRTQRAHRLRVEDELLRWAGVHSDEAIGQRLGLAPRTVRNWRERLHIRRIDRWGWYTSGQAARVTGLSPQYLTRLARERRIRARRLVAGYGYRRGWWLFDAAEVERMCRERNPEMWRRWDGR